MSKKSRRERRRRQPRTSRISSHQREGKTLRPPLRTLSELKTAPWLRDLFPDAIWLCYIINHYGASRGLELGCRFIDCVEDILEQNTASGDAPMITGALSAFELVPADLRTKVITELKSRNVYEEGIPLELAGVLRLYSNIPGGWLATGWKSNRSVPRSTIDQVLRKTIVASADGQAAVATKAKILMMRAWFKHRKIGLPPDVAKEWGDILPRYPDHITEEERRKIEPAMRASFLAFAGAFNQTDSTSPAEQWAKSFWLQNWRLFKCELRETDGEGDEAEHRSAINEAQQVWLEELGALSDQFMTAATEADPDLYWPDRHEVLTGIVSRLLRSVRIMLQSPPLWTMEHGAGIVRSLVEGQIVLRWLTRNAKQELYSQFKDYGRGRLKLLKLHLEDYLDGLEEVPKELEEQLEYLTALVNRDISEEFLDISVSGNFAGSNIRKMAEEVGMLDDYRLLLAPASSSVHGEWAFLDLYALVTCQNPLHRWHRVPDRDLRLRLSPDIVETAMSRLSDIVGLYKTTIVTV